MKFHALILFCTLVLDAADYTTYIGDDLLSRPAAIATDSEGNTYVLTARFTRNAAIDYSGYSGAALVKLDPFGAVLLKRDLVEFSSGAAGALAVDTAGNIYVAGSEAQRNQLVSGFILKLDSQGKALFSTYLGGNQFGSSLSGVAVDASGAIYVTGQTDSPDYQHTSGSPQGTIQGPPYPTTGAFFAKISAAGVIIYAGAVAAANPCGVCDPPPHSSTSGNAIAVDALGNAFIAGGTTGSGLTGTEGLSSAAQTGAFAMKLNATGGLAYLTFVNASSPFESATGIAVDSAGNSYVVGVGLTKLNATGGTIWHTPGGGSAMAIDPAGNVWLSGRGSSGEFLSEMNSSGAGLAFSESRPANTVAAGLALDSNGVLHLAGSTGLISTFTPSQSQAPRIFGVANAAGGALSGRIANGEILSIYGEHFGPAANSKDIASSFSGFNAGLYVMFVSDTQINAIVPNLSDAVSTMLQLTVNGVSLGPMRLAIDPVDPEIFQTSSGSAAVNQDGTLNSSTNPAKTGSFVSIYASGAGGSGPEIASGAYQYTHTQCAIIIPAGASPVLNGSLYVPYCGAAPGLIASVTQIDFQIPPAFPPHISVELNVDGIYSDPITLWVAP